MGKNLIQQRRGRGTLRFNAPSFNYIGKVKYRKYDDKEQDVVKGKIIDIVNCAGHSAPLLKVQFDTKEDCLFIAPENVAVNDLIESGTKAQPKNGNILPLKNIPEGSFIYNLELMPGDGGKLIRTAGSSARIISRLETGEIIVKLPSKKNITLNGDCRATLGIIAGGGRKEKPFVKAGNKRFSYRAKNRFYPIVSGVSMNPINHPFGCGRGRHKGRKTIPRRGAPPGAKVGLIRARRTGHQR